MVGRGRLLSDRSVGPPIPGLEFAIRDAKRVRESLGTRDIKLVRYRQHFVVVDLLQEFRSKPRLWVEVHGLARPTRSPSHAADSKVQSKRGKEAP